MKSRFEFKGIGLMLMCSLLWSTAGLFIKLVPWNSTVLAGMRGIFAALCMAVYLIFKKYRLRITKRTLLIGASVSLTSFLFIAANKYTTAANAIVLQYTSPVFLMLFSALFLKTRFRKLDYAAVIVTIAGIALMFADELTLDGMLGNVFAIVDGACLAAMYALTGQSTPEDRIAGLLLGNIITALIGIPFMALHETQLTATAIGAVAIMGIFQVGLPYILYSIAVKTCKPLACSLIASLELILSPIWVLIFVGEAPGTFALIGSVIIVAAITAWCCLGGAQAQPAQQAAMPAEPGGKKRVLK